MSASSAVARISSSSVVLARLLEVVLELEVAVEVVLDGALAATGDDEDVVDAGAHGLLDHVLDGRLVDDRQHLLRLAFVAGRNRVPRPAAGITALRHARRQLAHVETLPPVTRRLAEAVLLAAHAAAAGSARAAGR